MSYLTSSTCDSSIVATMSSVISGASSIESHLNMAEGLSQSEENITDRLKRLYDKHKADMGCVTDVIGIISFGRFKIRDQQFYLLIAKSGMSSKVDADDIAIFCGDTKDKLGLTLKGFDVTDKYFCDWIFQKCWTWSWPTITFTDWN
jgi:hypothetical protein